MNIKNIKELIEYPKEGIVSKSIVKNEKIDITLFCMAGGTDISEHTSTKQGVVYVIEGEGTFNLEGNEIKMGEGVIIHMDKDAKHFLSGVKNTSFLLTLV